MGLFEFLGPSIIPHPGKPHNPQTEQGPWDRETPTVMFIPPHVEEVDLEKNSLDQNPPLEIRL